MVKLRDLKNVIPIKRADEISPEEREQWREMNRKEKENLLRQVVAELTSRDLDGLSRRERRKLERTLKDSAWAKILAEKPHVPKMTPEETDEMLRLPNTTEQSTPSSQSEPGPTDSNAEPTSRHGN